jgi:hypothetical protein
VLHAMHDAKDIGGQATLDWFFLSPVSYMDLL